MCHAAPPTNRFAPKRLVSSVSSIPSACGITFDHFAFGCTQCAAQIWLGLMARFSGDLAAALGHFTAASDAAADRPQSRALTAALAGRAAVIRPMGRTAEAARDARCALALAREIGDPAAEVLALGELGHSADYAGDHDEAVRLARQAGQITAGIPGPIARTCSAALTIVLAHAGIWPKPRASARWAWPGPGTRATCGTRRPSWPGSRT